MLNSSVLYPEVLARVLRFITSYQSRFSHWSLINYILASGEGYEDIVENSFAERVKLIIDT